MPNKQVERIRQEINELMKDPELTEMSRAFRHALAQRLGNEVFAEGGLTLEGPMKITLREIFGDMDQEAIRKYLEEHIDDVAYANVYSYSFW